MYKNKSITVVIPVYNEEKYIDKTIKGISQFKFIDNIVIVDDGSTDGTLNKIKNYNVEIIKLNKNTGKGFAIKKAIRDRDFDILVLIDGDLGYTSKEIIKLINPIIEEKCDVSIAKFPKLNKKYGFGLVKTLSKIGVYIYTGKTLNCTLSGQRVYTKKSIENIKYVPDKFGIEVAMTIQALEQNLKIKEIDVNMKHRVTKKDIKGFFHRGRQFIHIFITLISLNNRR